MGERKKVALVLSGGGAIGSAHIGVIKVLKKYNVPIDIVVGTSMGGLIGAAYASGVDIDKMAHFAEHFGLEDFFDFNFDASGIFSGRGVMRNINKQLPDVQIEDLPITFACIAADLIGEKEVVFKSGSIREAVRATLSIPGFFVPMVKDNMILVDGGYMNNLPLTLAKELGADVIIASDVITNFKAKKKPRNALETLMYTVNLATKEIQRLKACDADVILTPDTSGLSLMGFSRRKIRQAIKIGEQEAESKIESIINATKQ